MLIPIEPTSALLPPSVTVPRSLSPLTEAAQQGRPLLGPIQEITRAMGFTTFVYGVGTGTILRGEERFYVWSTAPREWIGEYDQQSYVEVDPRVTHAWNSLPPPLLWDQTVANGDPRVVHFLDRAASYGIGSGVAIYLHDDISKVLVALSQPARQLTERRRAQMSASMGDAMALASIFHLIFMKEVVAKGIPPVHQGSPLSARECQCLGLAAHGMTSLDIGEKLGITERTANFHFSNIISKLGVLNRNEAIAKGIAHGLIRVDASTTPIKPMPSSKIREAQLKRWEARRNAQRETRPRG